MNHVKNQVNFNSVLLLILGALAVFTIKKLDENNTELIKVSNGQSYLMRRIEVIEQRMIELVAESEAVKDRHRIEDAKRRNTTP